MSFGTGTKTALPNLIVSIDSFRLSDMFFNHSHDHWDLLHQAASDNAGAYEDSPTPDERFTAIREDASAFLSELTGKRHDDPETVALAGMLADDFLGRV